MAEKEMSQPIIVGRDPVTHALVMADVCDAHVRLIGGTRKCKSHVAAIREQLTQVNDCAMLLLDSSAQDEER